MPKKFKILLIVFALLVPQVLWAHSFGIMHFFMGFIFLLIGSGFISILNSIVIAIFWKNISNRFFLIFTIYKIFSIMLSLVLGIVIYAFGIDYFYILDSSMIRDNKVLYDMLFRILSIIIFFLASFILDIYIYQKIGKQMSKTFYSSMLVNAKVNAIMTVGLLLIYILFIIF